MEMQGGKRRVAMEMRYDLPVNCCANMIPTTSIKDQRYFLAVANSPRPTMF